MWPEGNDVQTCSCFLVSSSKYKGLLLRKGLFLKINSLLNKYCKLTKIPPTKIVIIAVKNNSYMLVPILKGVMEVEVSKFYANEEKYNALATGEIKRKN